MPENSQAGHVANVCYVQEVILAVNAGFVCMLAVFGFGPESLVSWLYRLDSSIRPFHLWQPDLATMDFVFLIFSTALALCTWISLRLAGDSLASGKVLRLVSGIVAIDGVPLIWSAGWKPWLHMHIWYLLGTLQFFEAGLMAVCIVLYWYRRWRVPAWVAITILVAHFALWFQEFGLFDGALSGFRYRRFRMSDLLVPGGYPVALLIGFCSAVVWVIYDRGSGIENRK